ncbi:MAG: hemerythrin domain-containing protein [Bacteroidetes bacterium]|nr:hemerythrin domain-containing protein [Bacteroidota bacterium]
MNTARLNPFNEIHKALRTLMFDTVLKLQRSNLADPAETRPAIAQVELLVELMDGHAHHEDEFVLHPAEEIAPGLIHEFESEHVTDMALTNDLRQRIADYHKAEDKEYSGRQLYYALNAFVAFNLNHMNKEEQVLNPVLWSNYSDEQLLEMVGRIKQSVPPEEMRITLEWMRKGLNSVELQRLPVLQPA